MKKILFILLLCCTTFTMFAQVNIYQGNSTYRTDLVCNVNDGKVYKGDSNFRLDVIFNIKDSKIYKGNFTFIKDIVATIKDGKVFSGVLSEQNGTFVINNLDTEDSYYIYVLPPRAIENMPSYYASIQTMYCSGKPYVPSFFTKCGGREKGRPQSIYLGNKTTVDIGNVSIRCDEGVRPDYLYEKMKSIK